MNETSFELADTSARKNVNPFAFADRSASMKRHKFNFPNLNAMAHRRGAASALKKEHPNGRVLLLLWIESV